MIRYLILFLLTPLISISQCPNDICANAIDLGVIEDVICLDQCNNDCTDEGQETVCIGQDVDFWYTFEISAPITLAFDADGTYQHPFTSAGDGFQLVLFEKRVFMAHRHH